MRSRYPLVTRMAGVRFPVEEIFFLALVFFMRDLGKRRIAYSLEPFWVWPGVNRSLNEV